MRQNFQYKNTRVQIEGFCNPYAARHEVVKRPTLHFSYASPAINICKKYTEEIAYKLANSSYKHMPIRQKF